MISIPQLLELVQPLQKVFTRPARVLFENIIEDWILAPCRRFVTSIYQFGDPKRFRAHDAYHRWFRIGAWSLTALRKALALTIVRLFGHPNVLWLIGDDTVHKKTGRQVNGAKMCRDAVRSTATKIVYVWGLQIVLLCLEIIPPWGGEPLALPINLRLYRKRPNKKTGKSFLDLMLEMLEEVQSWFPERKIYFTADGLYAPLAGRLPAGIHIISRIRSDAAIYGKPPRRVPGQVGRPRTRGARLPTPEEIAAKATDWKPVKTFERGKERTRLAIVRHVIWHHDLPGRCIRLVIFRDPEGVEEDDYFFTTDLEMPPTFAVSRFSSRWAIEDTFRNCKQFLGIEEPQSWKGEGPERVATVGYVIYSLVWGWFLRYGDYKAFPARPWNKTKSRPSFQDALAGIRLQIWKSRFFETVPSRLEIHKFTETLIDALARAAS